jgi:hypothetical protein
VNSQVLAPSMRRDLVLFSYIFVLLGSSLTDPVGLQNASPTNLQRPNVHFLTHFILPGSLLTDLLFTNLRRDYVIPGSTTTTLSISRYVCFLVRFISLLTCCFVRYLRWNYVSSGSGLEDFQSPMHLKRGEGYCWSFDTPLAVYFRFTPNLCKSVQPLASLSKGRNYAPVFKVHLYSHLILTWTLTDRFIQFFASKLWTSEFRYGFIFNF